MRVQFEECECDPETRQVLRSCHAVALSPKAFHLLEILLRERPKALELSRMRVPSFVDANASS